MTLDLHGKNLYQARIALMSALKGASPSEYRLVVIHGYSGGRALKDMVLEEVKKHPRVLRIEPSSNPGQTVLVLREYY